MVSEAPASIATFVRLLSTTVKRRRLTGIDIDAAQHLAAPKRTTGCRNRSLRIRAAAPSLPFAAVWSIRHTPSICSPERL
jgi:hypothetical protein